MKKLLCTAALLVAFAAPAHARGFEGAYLGFNLGYNSTPVKVRFSAPAIPLSGTAQSSITGAEGSGTAGYRWLFDKKTMLGLELGAGYSGAKNDVFEMSSGGTGVSLSVKKRWNFTIGPRVGELFDDNTMGFAGFDFAHAYFSESTPQGSGSWNTDGLRLGLGVEWAATDTVHMHGLSFWHTMWKKENWSDGLGTFSLKPVENLVELGIVYPFSF